MINKILPIIMLFILLFSFGCMRSTPGIEPEVVDYHKGTKGLEISILKNLPPDKIIKENSFVIGVELVNSGAFDIEEGTISISGYDPKYVDVQELLREFELKGKQPGYPEGETMIINFNALNIDIPKGSDEYTASFTVNSQYKYRTEATTEVCINPDLYNIAKVGAICETKELTLSKGQGAPVAVTKITPVISPRNLDYDITFIIEIDNKGKGEVLGNIKIISAELSREKLKCPDTVDFNNKEGNLIPCSITLKDLRGAYVAPFIIKLEYEYENKVDKKLTIIDPLVKSKKI